MDKIFSVDELAKAGKITSRAIRLYIEKGLLEPVRVGRTLCFYEDGTQTLENILRAKRLGFSLEEIGVYRADCDADTLKGTIKRIEELKSDAEFEVAALESRLIQVRKRR